MAPAHAVKQARHTVAFAVALLCMSLPLESLAGELRIRGRVLDEDGKPAGAEGAGDGGRRWQAHVRSVDRSGRALSQAVLPDQHAHTESAQVERFDDILKYLYRLRRAGPRLEAR